MIKREFHYDTNDRILAEQILKEILTGYTETHWTEYKYDRIDGFVTTKKGRYKVHVKNRMNYSIDDFPTTMIDKTCYEDSIEDAILIILYPKNEKVLMFTSKGIRNAFKGNTIRDVISYSETKNEWYIEKNKELSELYINKGKIMTYQQLNIAV
jgi:hypothetical protein